MVAWASEGALVAGAVAAFWIGIEQSPQELLME